MIKINNGKFLNKKSVSPFFIYFLFFLASFGPFFIYGSNQLNTLYLNNSDLGFDHYFTTWLPSNIGTFSYFYVPYDIFVKSLFFIFPDHLVHQIAFGLILLTAFICFYKMAIFLFGSKKIGILGSFIYCYSIYGQFISSWPIHSGSIIFAVLPFYTYKILALKEKSSIVRNGLILGLITTLFIDINLTIILYFNLFILGLIIFRILFEGRKLLKKLIYTYFIYIAIYLLINSVYLITFAAEFYFQNNYVYESLSAESVEWKSSSSSLYELFRLMGALNFYYTFLDKPAYPNAQIFRNNPVFIFTSYLMVVVAISAFLIINNGKFWGKFKIFLLIVLLVCLFMGMGVYSTSPTKYLYSFFNDNIPFFTIFRDTYKMMFILNFIYSILICFTLYYLLKNHLKLYVWTNLILGISIAILSLQFWTGSFLKQDLIFVPKYWSDFGNYYNKMIRSGNVLFLPDSPFPVYKFVSYRGKASTFYRPLVKYSYINNINLSNFSNKKESQSLFRRYNSEEFPYLLGFYNISYILLQYDVDWQIYRLDNPLRIGSQLDNKLKLEKVFQ